MKYIDNFRDNNLKELVVTVTFNYSNDKKMEDAEKVIENLLFVLENDKVISGSIVPMFVDILIAAAYLHNIDFDPSEHEWYEIFRTRTIIDKFVKKEKFDAVTIDALYQAIECQLGKNTPNSLLYPAPNSPTAHFALACALSKR